MFSIGWAVGIAESCSFVGKVEFGLFFQVFWFIKWFIDKSLYYNPYQNKGENKEYWECVQFPFLMHVFCNLPYPRIY